MSNNLNIPQMAANQATPEVTHNDGLAALDAALTEVFTVDGTSGDVTLSAAQYRSAFKFYVTNIGVARNVTFPAVKRLVFVQVDAANAAQATLHVGSTAVLLSRAGFYAAMTDGTANGLVVVLIGTGTQAPFDLNVFLPGVMSNTQTLLVFNTVRPFTLPASLTGSLVTASVAATASTTVTLKKNGSSIGTLVWGIGGTVPTVTFASSVAFAATDVLEVDGPATADATLANIALNLLGSR